LRLANVERFGLDVVLDLRLFVESMQSCILLSRAVMLRL
jgi:hypothetical protein